MHGDTGKDQCHIDGLILSWCRIISRDGYSISLLGEENNYFLGLNRPLDEHNQEDIEQDS